MRVATGLNGAFGVLLQHDIPFAVTLERTYQTDQIVATKIPAGRYPCTLTRFEHGGYLTYEIHVPGHSRILFHKGNISLDSEGCVLVAESFGQIKGGPAIMDSASGFCEFFQLAGGRSDFVLEVV
jgi:hypothetical protein